MVGTALPVRGMAKKLSRDVLRAGGTRAHVGEVFASWSNLEKVLFGVWILIYLFAIGVVVVLTLLALSGTSHSWVNWFWTFF